MNTSIIHIAYGDSAAGCLREAIHLGMPGNTVIVCRDDYTQGPISDTIRDGGLVQRTHYWKHLETLHSPLKDVDQSYLSSLKRIDAIADNSSAVLWIGNSAHDILATSWIISYLQSKNIDWLYVDFKERPSTFDSINLAILSPQQVADEYQNINLLSSQLQEDYKTLWSKLVKENAPYRVLNDQSIVSVQQDYFDQDILSFINKKPQLLGKLLGSIMGKSKHRLSDVTIESRLVKLQAQKKISIQMNVLQVFMSKVKLK